MSADCVFSALFNFRSWMATKKVCASSNTTDHIGHHWLSLPSFSYYCRRIIPDFFCTSSLLHIYSTKQLLTHLFPPITPFSLYMSLSTTFVKYSFRLFLIRSILCVSSQCLPRVCPALQLTLLWKNLTTKKSVCVSDFSEKHWPQAMVHVLELCQ